MDNNGKSVYKAAAVIAGNGIGSGVMAIPYYLLHAGVTGSIAAFAFAYIVSVLMHLMIAEMVLHTGDTADILAIFNKYLFKGRAGRILRLAFFVLLIVVLIANLSAYISGASEILTEVIPVNGTVIKIVFFVAAAAVVLAGLSAVCTGEAVSVLLMAVILLFMGVFSLLHGKGDAAIPVSGGLREWAAAYGMIMFSFSAIFAVPQVIRYLSGEDRADISEKQADKGSVPEKKIKQAIWLGLLINLVISVFVAVCTIITSSEVTDIAIVGWAEAVGGTVRVLGSVFIIFAMLTSFWSIGLASADIVKDQTGLKREMSFVIATVPALILTIILSSGFTDYLKLVGGIVAIIISLMAVPSFLLCMKEAKRDNVPVSIIGKKGSMTIAVFIFIMYIVMAVGSCITV